MKYFPTSSKQLSVVGAVMVLLFQLACSSPKIAQVSPAYSPQPATTDATLPSEAFTASVEENSDEPAAASTQSKITSTPASTYVVAQQLQQEQEKNATAVQAAKKVKSPFVKMALKAAVKKVEKAHKKFDIKKNKSNKAANALDPDIRTGILIAVLGLALIIIDVIIDTGILYTLGAIGITVGLVVIILAALDVI